MAPPVHLIAGARIIVKDDGEYEAVPSITRATQGRMPGSPPGSSPPKGETSGPAPYDHFIQIDAPINRGNSGGTAFDVNGDVIGVNTAIFSPSGGSRHRLRYPGPHGESRQRRAEGQGPCDAWLARHQGTAGHCRHCRGPRLEGSQGRPSRRNGPCRPGRQGRSPLRRRHHGGRWGNNQRSA
ncbi:hypothetical protein ABIE78_002812 [Sinorhizobium fredii]